MIKNSVNQLSISFHSQVKINDIWDQNDNVEDLFKVCGNNSNNQFFSVQC